MLNDLIDNNELISFDIFDTLLLRPFVKPQDVFGYLEIFSKKAGFAKERITAEKKARILKLAREKKEDCTIEDIYKQIPSEYIEMKIFELDFENQISIRNEEIFEYYKYALEKGKKVIVTSDMYLKRGFLEEILSKNGILGFDCIFVSSEIGLTKSSGNLYKHILSTYNIEPQKILHIGDNEIADVQKANDVGIQSYHYIPKISKFFSDNYNKRMVPFYKQYESNPILSSLIGLRIAYEEKYKNENYWFNLGYKYGGILAIEMALNAYNISKENNLTDLFFISRDAFLPEEVFRLYNKSLVKSHYITLNRVIKHKYSNIEKNENNELLNYFKSIKTNGKKIGIVDTSAGTFSAQEILEDYMPDIEFLGIYLHTRKNDIFNYINLSTLDIEDVKNLFNLNFIEILLTSLEPKIEDIKNNKPVYETNENEHEVIKRNFYKLILEGERAFAKDYKDIFKNYICSCDIKTIYEYISNFWQNLTEVDRKHLSEVKNSVDTQQTMYVSLINDKQDIAAQLRKRLLLNKKLL